MLARHAPVRFARLVAPLLAILLLAADGTDADWLDSKVPADVRVAADQLVGYALPPATPGVRWFGGTPEDPADGTVTVVQIFSMEQGGRSLIRSVRGRVPDGARLMIIHTLDNAEKVARNLERSPPAMPLALDTDGAWLQARGLPDTPLNLVIDVNGAVRHVGLRADAIRDAVNPLLQEKPDPARKAKPRPPTRKPPVPPAAGFPRFTEPVQNATDRRGQRMPDFHVDKWITARPDAPTDKLLLIDFWATWCPPCMASIPRLAELANTHRDIATVVGVTDEPEAQVIVGLTNRQMDPRAFPYSLASDPARTLYNFFGARAIPHLAVVSSDGIVRWQGHPESLTADTFRQLADAQRALNGAAAGSGTKGSGGTGGSGQAGSRGS
jgi:thiol-disulfide isomerase/thioredoxin/ribosomal protein S28E/S33